MYYLSHFKLNSVINSLSIKTKAKRKRNETNNDETASSQEIVTQNQCKNRNFRLSWFRIALPLPTHSVCPP